MSASEPQPPRLADGAQRTMATLANGTTSPRVAGSQSATVLRLENVSKFFGRLKAVDQVSLDIHAGEVLTLLGPSGCGKTTTLRIVIGLERCDEGSVVYDGNVVDAAGSGKFLPTHKRNMGMVFQSYAIWPHMTVFENVAYPLRVRRISNREVVRAVENVLDQVGLSGLGARPASMLSGGQQQRVALARSLVFEPKILLLDEPFSNLDAKLREYMRAELKVLQRRLGITVLMVTHDQVEALSLSDRIAVMSTGQVEQIGSPLELYRAPRTSHVRDFLGKTIVFPARVAQRHPDSSTVEVVVEGGPRLIGASDADCSLAEGQRCFVAVRPEQVEIQVADSRSAYADGTPNMLMGTIEALLFIGDRYEARVTLPWGESCLVFLAASEAWVEGQSVTMRLPPSEIHVWPDTN